MNTQKTNKKAVTTELTEKVTEIEISEIQEFLRSQFPYLFHKNGNCKLSETDQRSMYDNFNSQVKKQVLKKTGNVQKNKSKKSDQTVAKLRLLLKYLIWSNKLIDTSIPNYSRSVSFISELELATISGLSERAIQLYATTDYRISGNFGHHWLSINMVCTSVKPLLQKESDDGKKPIQSLNTSTKKAKIAIENGDLDVQKCIELNRWYVTLNVGNSDQLDMYLKTEKQKEHLNKCMKSDDFDKIDTDDTIELVKVLIGYDEKECLEMFGNVETVETVDSTETDDKQ